MKEKITPQKKKIASRAATVLAALVIFSSIIAFVAEVPYPAYAAAPSQIAPDVGTVSSDYQFALLDYSPTTYVKTSDVFYADNLTIYGDHVYFNNTALTAAGDASNSFGLGAKSGNITLTSIANAAVSVQMSCANLSVCYSYYYYPAANPVYLVNTLVAGSSTVMVNSGFYTNYTAFSSASAPATYLNTTGRYLQTKVTYQSTTQVSYYLNVGNGTFIYVDTGASQAQAKIRVYKPDATAIPAGINIYVTDSPATWGTPVKTNYALAQSTGYEEISLNNAVGRYVVMSVNNWGSASTWKVAIMQYVPPDSTHVAPSAEAVAAFNTTKNTAWAVIGILPVSLFFGIYELLKRLGY